MRKAESVIKQENLKDDCGLYLCKYRRNSMSNAKKMAALAVEALEDKKANSVTILDIEKITTIADYFIIASGNNKNQVQAMTDEVLDKLGRAGFETKHVEGYNTANWILLDYGDIVIHIFDEENRLFYDLERIWRDGKAISKEELNG